MNRPRQMAVSALLVTGTLGACGDESTILPTRNLDRPADVAFVCMGTFPSDPPDQATLGLSGRPMAECHPLSEKDPAAAPTRRTFALVTNTARGELAVVDMDRSRLLDLDPGVPGFSFAPLGVLPESLAVSSDGCRAVTANRGSCDLTFVDPALLVGEDIIAQTARGAPRPTGVVSETVMPHGRSGRLHVAPHDIVFLAQPTALLREGEHLCSAAGAFVAAEPATRAPWKALVTFPACDLVAVVELPSGRITSSAYIRPEGVVPAGDDPICPRECGPGFDPTQPTVDGSVVDANDGAVDGPDDARSDSGAPPDPPQTFPLRVGPLALLPDGSRVYVGAAAAPFITALDLRAGDIGVPGHGGRIDLHDGAIGVTRLRLSVDPFGGPEARGRFVGERGEFLYAFSRDGSIRVVDVGRRLLGDQHERECDTNVDPLAIVSADARVKGGCFPIGDPASPPARQRALARSPGIRFPFSLPVDVAFASLTIPGEPSVADSAIDGAFGFVLAANGSVVLVNVDPTPRLSEHPLPLLSHSLRDANVMKFDPGLRDGIGPARVETPPMRSFIDPVVATAVSSPRLEGIPTTSPVDNVAASEQAAAVSTFVFFPDRSAVLPQAWTLGWEASLPEATRASGKVRDPASPGAPAVLEDEGANFCRSGVLPGDVLDMQGCEDDAGCGYGQSCVRSPAAPRGVRGMCLSKEDVKGLTAHCARAISSLRRYEVVKSSRARLEVLPRIDERVLPSIAPCVTNMDCRPMDDKTHETFVCALVRDGEARRCVQPCTSMTGMKDDTVCRPGHVCEDVGARADVGPLCVSGPPLDAACFSMYSPYAVQVGRGFLVSGGAMPRFDVAKEQGGVCVDDKNRHPLLVNRIPLGAPACANVLADTPSLDAARASPAPNPCLFRAKNSDATDENAPPAVKALFQNAQLRFVLTNLEVFFGDGLEIRFNVNGGFRTTQVIEKIDVNIALPVRIVTGPLEIPGSPGDRGIEQAFFEYPYLYVIDQGRFGPTSVRGQMARINPVVPEFDDLSPETPNPFLIQ